MRADEISRNLLAAVDPTGEEQRLQRIVTIAQLAHEWAKARRARLVFTYPPFRECESPVPEGPESGETPCLHTQEIFSERDLRPDMCPPCREAAVAIIKRRKLAAKLSGLSARLERACLGPRPKRAAVCPACHKGKDGCACTVEEREAAYTVTL